MISIDDDDDDDEERTKSRNERVGSNAGFIVMSTGSGTLVYAYVNTRQRSRV